MYDPYVRLSDAHPLLDREQSLATCTWLAALTDRECARVPRRHVASFCLVYQLPGGQTYTVFLPQN